MHETDVVGPFKGEGHVASLDLSECGEGGSAQVKVLLPGVAPALVRAEVGDGHNHVAVDAQGVVNTLDLEQKKGDCLIHCRKTLLEIGRRVCFTGRARPVQARQSVRVRIEDGSRQEGSFTHLTCDRGPYTP
jgi:hypothetical protein